MLKQKVLPVIFIFSVLTSMLWSEVTISSNSSFTSPTEINFSSTNISLLNFNLFNPEAENRYVESLEFEVSSGNALDVTDLILMQGTTNLNELYNGALNIESSGNLKLSFSPAIQFTPGDNLNYDVLASIGPTTDSDNNGGQRGTTVTSGTRSSGLLTGISYTHKGSTKTVTSSNLIGSTLVLSTLTAGPSAANRFWDGVASTLTEERALRVLGDLNLETALQDCSDPAGVQHDVIFDTPIIPGEGPEVFIIHGSLTQAIHILDTLGNVVLTIPNADDSSAVTIGGSPFRTSFNGFFLRDNVNFQVQQQGSHGNSQNKVFAIDIDRAEVAVIGGIRFGGGGGCNYTYEILGFQPPVNNADIELSLAPQYIQSGSSNLIIGDSFGTGVVALNHIEYENDPTRLAAGHEILFLVNGNALLSKGRNESGQLGRSGDNLSMLPITTISDNINLVEAGAEHVIALDEHQQILTWGLNNFGQSHGNTTVEVDTSLGNVVLVAAGAYSSYAVTESGNLWAKGRNNLGQLGLGDTTDRGSWTEVTSLPAGNIHKISAGVEHVLLLIDQALYGFGSNGFGQLSQGNMTIIPNPTLIDGSSNWNDIAAGGFHSFALNSTQTIYACGKNTHGQLGIGTNSNSETTLTALANLGIVLSIAAGYEHSLFLIQYGAEQQCYATGSMRYAQLSQNGESNTPIPVVPYFDVEEINAGPYSSVLIQSDMAQIWGILPDGQIQSNPIQFYTLDP